MKAYWQQLNEREQIAVVVMGVFAVLYLFYALIYAPLVSSVAVAQADWHMKKDTLIWMRHAEQNYDGEKKPQTVAAGNLLSILTQVLNQSSFRRFPYQLSQTATGEIQLNFEQVPYNGFILWLQAQSTRYTMTVKHLDITKTDVAGVVKASVMFSVE